MLMKGWNGTKIYQRRQSTSNEMNQEKRKPQQHDKMRKNRYDTLISMSMTQKHYMQ
jgi:hypothetical protein